MYRVILKDDYSDQFEKVLHEPLANGNKLLSGRGTLRLVGCSSFTAQIPPTNDYFHAINSIKSIIEIYDVINDRLIFEGRVLDQLFAFKKEARPAPALQSKHRLKVLSCFFCSVRRA